MTTIEDNKITTFISGDLPSDYIINTTHYFVTNTGLNSVNILMNELESMNILTDYFLEKARIKGNIFINYNYLKFKIYFYSVNNKILIEFKKIYGCQESFIKIYNKVSSKLDIDYNLKSSQSNLQILPENLDSEIIDDPIILSDDKINKIYNNILILSEKKYDMPLKIGLKLLVKLISNVTIEKIIELNLPTVLMKYFDSCINNILIIIGLKRLALLIDYGEIRFFFINNKHIIPKLLKNKIISNDKLYIKEVNILIPLLEQIDDLVGIGI